MDNTADKTRIERLAKINNQNRETVEFLRAHGINPTGMAEVQVSEFIDFLVEVGTITAEQKVEFNTNIAVKFRTLLLQQKREVELAIERVKKKQREAALTTPLSSQGLILP